MEDIKIIDDFLPTYLQDKLEELCYDNGTPFEILSTTVSFDKIDKNKNKYYSHEQFVSLFKDKNGMLNPNSPLHYFQIPIQIGLLNLGITYNFSNLERLKINITYNDYSNIKNKINPPHRDPVVENNNSSLIGIYYVNNSDGDTIIYDNGKIEKTISPKKGRLLIMDGKKLHSSSHPSINHKRIIVNYNLSF